MPGVGAGVSPVAHDSLGAREQWSLQDQGNIRPSEAQSVLLGAGDPFSLPSLETKRSPLLSAPLVGWQEKWGQRQGSEACLVCDVTGGLAQLSAQPAGLLLLSRLWLLGGSGPFFLLL